MVIVDSVGLKVALGKWAWCDLQASMGNFIFLVENRVLGNEGNLLFCAWV